MRSRQLVAFDNRRRDPSDPAVFVFRHWWLVAVLWLGFSIWLAHSIVS